MTPPAAPPRRIRHRFRGQVSINAVATIAQAVLGVAAIPVGTLVLGPADYGSYALMLAFVGPAVALTEAGAGVLLAERWQQASHRDRSDMLASLGAISGTLGLAAAALVMAGVLLVAPRVGLAGVLPAHDAALACAALPVAALAAVARGALTIDGRAAFQSLAAALQAFAGLLTLAALLFVAGVGRTALFGAYLAGTLAGFALMAWALRWYRGGRPRRAWLAEGRRNAGPSSAVSAADHGRGMLEGLLVTQVFGAAMLGLFAHARLYHGMLMQLSNVVATALWPIALAEARRPDSDFLNVRRAWDLVHMGMGCAGVLAALWGRPLLDLLTHGRFVDAAWMLPVLVGLLLVQTAGRPALAACYALGGGRQALWARLGAIMAGVAVLLSCLWHRRFEAVLAALLAEQLVFRAVLALIARRLRPVPFQDGMALAGLAATLAAAWTAPMLPLPLARVAATAGLVAVLAWLAWPSLVQAAQLGRSFLPRSLRRPPDPETP
jgi:PST family polysaccharide transporter